MIGIDATHAWAAVWTPQPPGQFEWLGLDPTNDQMVDERYVIVGRGRDYADVPPLRGHHLHQFQEKRDRRRGRRRALRR